MHVRFATAHCACDSAALAGTTEESNWVIPGRLLVGAYPASVHDETNARILSGILSTGVTTFVCLQQEYVRAHFVGWARYTAVIRALLLDASCADMSTRVCEKWTGVLARS